jgi:serine/threonine protein kinase
VGLSADILELLCKDDEFFLYRDKPSSVLLLAPVSDRLALDSLRKIEHEYSLKDELDPAWAVRPPALSQQHRQTTLVPEDPGGETLDRLVPGPLETTQFLRLAVGLAASLCGLHKKELIHKDLKPANVLVNLATGEVRLMGFGIASRLPRERQAPEPPEFIAGTLPLHGARTNRTNEPLDRFAQRSLCPGCDAL